MRELRINIKSYNKKYVYVFYNMSFMDKLNKSISSTLIQASSGAVVGATFMQIYLNPQNKIMGVSPFIFFVGLFGLTNALDNVYNTWLLPLLPKAVAVSSKFGEPIVSGLMSSAILNVFSYFTLGGLLSLQQNAMVFGIGALSNLSGKYIANNMEELNNKRVIYKSNNTVHVEPDKNTKIQDYKPLSILPYNLMGNSDIILF